MGVNILGFRVGELAILTSFVFLILFMTILFKSNIVEQINSNQIYLSLILFTLTFLLLVFYSDGSFSNLYIYKSSSYIWSLGFIVLGLVIGNTSNISHKNIYPFFFICIFIYFYSIYGIPDSYQSIFLNFSDKFEYHKNYSKVHDNYFHISHNWKTNSTKQWLWSLISLSIFKLKKPLKYCNEFLRSLIK